MTIEEILSILQYPKPIHTTIRSVIPNVLHLVDNAYCDTDFNYPVVNYSPLERLAVITYLLAEKYDDYRSLGISDPIIEATFRDVALHAKQYHKATGTVGLSADDAIWFRHIINVEIFRIGSLQFQPFKMIYLDEENLGEPYMVFMDKQKALLPPGSPVINCHIPADANLQSKEILSSFIDAKALFSKLYPETAFKAFLCYSWLLYPNMHALLSKNSNIKQFADFFDIISACPDPAQAIANIHGQTTLSLAIQSSPSSFGYACGILWTDASYFKP